MSKQQLIILFILCIEPNSAIVSVPDDRLNKLAQLAGSAKIIPAYIEFVDIAGLVK